MNFGTSAQVAVQQVRAMIEGSYEPIDTANKIIHGVTGMRFATDDPVMARIVAQYAVERFVRSGSIAQSHDVFSYATERANAFRQNEKNSWMFVSSKQYAAQPVSAENAIVDGGKIRHGGKQVLVADLYRQLVLETDAPLSNKEFVEILMSELNMTKASAYTHTSNVRKELGEPEGGIAKEKRGRKPKAV